MILVRFAVGGFIRQLRVRALRGSYCKKHILLIYSSTSSTFLSDRRYFQIRVLELRDI